MRFIPGLLSAIMLCAGLAPAHSQTADLWPDPPFRNVLATPYGTLEVRTTSYVYGSALLLDGTEVEPPIEGLINISYAYRVGKRSVALISVDTGDRACPIHYHWIALDKSGHRVTKAFGSCSPKVRVSIHGRNLQLETPSADAPGKIDLWSYDGRSVRRRH
ncbi:hypothetical protein [Castellaniella sp. GW247-6E4]|uniref:hypothetical protein n=1 Tax=Castellaniella sp. GW247-6E4 TaxID=3140380 RepID=UPI0033146EF9